MLPGSRQVTWKDREATDGDIHFGTWFQEIINSELSPVSTDLGKNYNKTIM